jgi:hypothetical protein
VDKKAKLSIGLAVTGALFLAGSAIAASGVRINEVLGGYEEAPAVSTAASGRFQATVTPAGDAINFRISYAGLEGDVTQAHIHFGQKDVNGGISAFFCSNLGNGPAGTPACPPAPATVTGTIEADDVIGPAAQGIAAGEMAELVKAIRAGVTYANVHSTKFPSGEIRGQLGGVRADNDVDNDVDEDD